MRWRYRLIPALLVLLAIGVALPRNGASDPVLRTVDVGFGPTAAATVEQTGRVFVSTVALNGGVVALDGTTGEKLGSVALAPLPAAAGQGVSTLAANGGQLMLYRPPNQALRLDPRSGAVLPQLPSGSGGSLLMGGKPAHTVTFAPDYSGLSVRDAATNQLVAHIPLPPSRTGISISARFQRLYLTTADGTLQVIDAYHGRLLRTVRLPASAVALLISEATGQLFVLVTDGTDYTLVMLDAASGAMLRATRTGLGATSAPAGALSAPAFLLDSDETTGQIMLTSQSSDQVWLFSTRSGLPIRTVHIGPHPTAWAVDSARHHLLVATTNVTIGLGYPTGYGTLWVIDLRSGRVSDTLPIGAAPIAVSLELHTHRAFIVNANVNPDFTPLIFHPRQSWWEAHSSQFHQWLPFLPAPSIPISTGTVTVVDLNRL